MPYITKFLYSFHLPIFFVISGMFSKAINKPIQAVKRNCMFYIKPYFITCSIILSLLLIVSFVLPIDIDFRNYIQNIFSFGIINGRDIGPIWFLFALFWGQTMYELAKSMFNDVYLAIFCISICIIGMQISSYIHFSFLWFLQGCAIQPFLFAGDIVFRNKIGFKTMMNNKFMLSLIIIIYVISLIHHKSIVIAFMSYPIGLTSVFSAICISLILVWKCNIIDCKFLQVIGKHTLIILCVHTVFVQLRDRCGNPFYYITQHGSIRIILEVTSDILFSLFIAMLIVYLKQRFSIRNYHILR